MNQMFTSHPAVCISQRTPVPSRDNVYMHQKIFNKTAVKGEKGYGKEFADHVQIGSCVSLHPSAQSINHPPSGKVPLKPVHFTFNMVYYHPQSRTVFSAQN